jgi:hypothetical protein
MLDQKELPKDIYIVRARIAEIVVAMMWLPLEPN